MLKISDQFEIPDDALDERFIRSPGAGGQNVNKVATGVQLRFDAKNSAIISNSVFLRLKALAGVRMTNMGVVVISATRFRTQVANRKDARARLAKLIAIALVPPKVRRATKPSKTQKKKRLDDKKHGSAIKKSRGRVGRNSDDF